MGSARPAPAPLIEIVEPDPADCPSILLPPEGNVKLRNYRLLTENLRAYTPTGDVNTSPTKGKLVAKFDSCASISPPRSKILELVRDGDPGREALEAIVRPAPRRLQQPLDDDARRFLQRALHSPSPYLSPATTPEPQVRPPESSSSESSPSESPPPPESPISTNEGTVPNGERSLAEELREAEEDVHPGGVRQEVEFERECMEAFERERLGRLALSVEEDESDGGLSLAARRLDALLAESRALHAELASIQADLQVLARRLARSPPDALVPCDLGMHQRVQCVRAGRCADDARALSSESRALRYLDDVVALLRGDVAAAVRARLWPFAIGRRVPGRNYII